jgi:NAD(P)-dependent dehydrogenase (short-subunit alcohol dehydrogenase family)
MACGPNSLGRKKEKYLMSDITTPVQRPLEPRKHAIVIGASSGIGAALVWRLVLQGYRVAALARREEELNILSEAVNGNLRDSADPRVLVYRHDVTDYTAVPALFQDIVRDLGGLDLIIYVAGIQPVVAQSEYNFDKDASMVQVNLLGAIAWLNQAAIRFDRARHGHIVGVSSIAGDRGRVGAPVYNTSKAGLNTYLEALRNRLARRGVTVTTIKPGFIDTKMLANAPKTFWIISPEDAAAQIYLAILRKRGTVYIPRRWGLVGLIIRHIPSFIFRWMNF